MTKLEKTVEALRRCIPADKFEKELAEIEKEEGQVSKSVDAEAIARDLLFELGTPEHIKGYPYLITALLAVVEDPDLLHAVTKGLYIEVAGKHNTTASRAERAIRHAVEVTWDRGDVDVLDKYFGNTVSPNKGKPTNSEFLARVSRAIRERLKEAQA